MAGCLGTQALAIPFELKFTSQLPYLELEDLRLLKIDSSTASDVIVQQRPMLEVSHNQMFIEDLEICYSDHADFALSAQFAFALC